MPAGEVPDLLRNWFLGSRARRHLSRERFAAVTGSLPRGRGERALDIGCGWGYNLFLLHHRGFEPYGIDIVRNDFAAARRIALANGHRADLASADASALPFRDAVFSAVTAVETFEHIYAPDRKLAVREIARVLVPGGFLVMSTPNYQSIVERGKRLLMKAPFLQRLFPTMCYPAGEVGRDEYHPYRYHDPLPEGEIRSLLAGNGFEITGTRRILFVWKNTPDFLFPAARRLEAVCERLPLVRLLASTLVVVAIRSIPTTRRDAPTATMPHRP